MLRAALPRQRNVVWAIARRAQTTSTTPPIIPKAPASPEATAPPAAHPQPPPLPPDPPKENTSSSESKSQSSSTPPTPPPPPKPKRRRFRRYFVYPAALLGLSYAAGVYYSLTNDNFHDFFTEYIPFGEDAVLYFEEREFRRRFPEPTLGGSKTYQQISGEPKVHVSKSSGVTPRSTQQQDQPKIQDEASKKTTEAANTAKDKAKSAGAKATATGKKAEEAVKNSLPAKDDAKSTGKSKQSASQQPSTTPQLDPLKISNASDPIVRSVTSILNSIITSINADEAASKYSSTINKAKDDIAKLAADITAYRASDVKAAEDKIRENELKFDQGAQDLIARVQREQREQELAFREEYEAERERLARSYHEKLKTETGLIREIESTQRRNDLLAQDIKLTDQFAQDVRGRVEAERDSRLSRLNELTRDVEDLEDLTKRYSTILDTNLQTQHLITAVEAIRSALDDADRPKPFIHELVALKEIAHDSTLINAAIASIAPESYQRGIPPPAQIIDRFRHVANEVRKASLLPEDAGAASHAASLMLSRFMFKKEGVAVGDDVESVLTRTEMLLEEGDLDGATREMNGLTGWARVLSRDWLGECRRALEVRQALDVSF